MKIDPGNMNVSQYCEGFASGKIKVNADYQRSDAVWPKAARSYLIESIILGFPLPKFTHYLITDLKSKATYREIVDGQQRSKTIFEFYSDEFPLSRFLETRSLRGKKYSQLEADDQEAFLNARLAIDELTDTDRTEVREAFRRMNSYTVPLNAEEHRHAVYQGEFKWFVQGLGKKFNGPFVDMGIFTEKQLVRMADTKLIAEIVHAMIHGITTTNKKSLDSLYRTNDRVFARREEFDDRLTQALDTLRAWQDLHDGPLMKHYTVYALVLALLHLQRPLDALGPIVPVSKPVTVHEPVARENLSLLSEALLSPETAAPELREFVKAASEKTNVKSQREVRFRWMCKALMGALV